MKTNPLVELQKYGQSFWLDNINRRRALIVFVVKSENHICCQSL